MSPRLRRGLPVVLAGTLTAAAAAGIGLAVAPCGASAAEPSHANQVRAPADAQPIPGQYIVVLKKKTAGIQSLQSVRQTVRGLAGRHGGTVTHTFSSALQGYVLHASAAQAEAVANDRQVAFVQQDARVHISDTQNNATWGLDRIDQHNLPLDKRYTFATKAEDVNAYIIDTGIRTSHSDFGGRASVGTDTVGDGRNGIDCNGHGTHVAGTVGGSTFGVAKGVHLFAVRVLDCQGSGTDSGVIAGIDWVTKNAKKPAVANMSLGGDASPALDNALRNSVAAGVTYAVAAGNENQNACNVSPARVAEAITVGATTKTDARASFSNFGTCVDIFAPGQGITSAWNTSDTATNTISGTSMATPHTTGAAALFLATHASATPQQVRDGLVGAATSGVVTGAGSGSPNKLLFTGSGGGTPEPTPSPTPTPTPPPGGTHFENTSRVTIPDAGPAAESPIAVTGVSGKAPSGLKVAVDITHSYRGDLIIDLVAPDGSVYRLKNFSFFDAAADVKSTFTVNASSETANGTWKLRVRDMARNDTGMINKWALDF
jgi:subtilisin family serine protease